MDTLTVGECAQLLGISPDTVRRMVDTGTLASVRLTDESWRRVPKSAIVELAERRNIQIDWSLIDKQ